MVNLPACAHVTACAMNCPEGCGALERADLRPARRESVAPMRACRRHRKTGRLCLAVAARFELVRAGAVRLHQAVGGAVLTITNRCCERFRDGPLAFMP